MNWVLAYENPFIQTLQEIPIDRRILDFHVPDSLCELSDEILFRFDSILLDELDNWPFEG